MRANLEHFILKFAASLTNFILIIEGLMMNLYIHSILVIRYGLALIKMLFLLLSKPVCNYHLFHS